MIVIWCQQAEKKSWRPFKVRFLYWRLEVKSSSISSKTPSWIGLLDTDPDQSEITTSWIVETWRTHCKPSTIGSRGSWNYCLTDCNTAELLFNRIKRILESLSNIVNHWNYCLTGTRESSNHSHTLELLEQLDRLWNFYGNIRIWLLKAFKISLSIL